MNHLTPLFDNEWVQALGWTLLHSLWQGVALALLLAIALTAFRKQSANSRYLTGIFTLIALLICMSITFTLMYAPAAKVELVHDPASTTFSAYEEADISAPVSPEADELIEENVTLSSVFVAYFEEHMPFLILLYLIGVLILSMRMLGELVYLQNLRYSRSLFVSKAWQQKLQEMANKLGISTVVAIKESLRVSSPMIVGFLKPVIFITVGMLANLPSNQIESILAHELAHIRRHDYLINLVQSFVEILLFFNPAVWWISSFIRSEREHCCDDIAIQLTGDELTFARTLANLEEWRSRNSRLAVAFAGKRSSGVLGRIQRLLEKKEPTQLPFRLFWSAAILSAGLLFVAFSSKNALAAKNDLTELSAEIDTAEDASPAYQADFSAVPFNSNDESHFIVDQISETGIHPQNTFDFASSTFREFDQMSNDTTPESIGKLNLAIHELQRSFDLKREGLHKQMKELELKKYAFEKDLQKQDFQTKSAQMELHKDFQRIEKEKMMQERELELQQTNQEQAILELQHQIQELELQLDFKNEDLSENENDEKIKNEINKTRKEIQELKKTTLLREQELQKRELEVRKQAILKDKEMQEIMYKNQLLEYENQIKAQSKEAEMLNFEESIRQLKFQAEELEIEFQTQMEKLEHLLDTEHDKMEEGEY